MPLEPSPPYPPPCLGKDHYRRKAEIRLFLIPKALVNVLGEFKAQKNSWVMYKHGFLHKGKEIGEISKMIFDICVSLAEAQIN